MYIERVVVKNYRSLRDLNLTLKKGFNLIVGDNETGKSSLLEAINLCLKGQLNRKPIRYELHPFLFNVKAIEDYLNDLKNVGGALPPSIMVEVYLAECPPELEHLKGTNNSLGFDTYGLSLIIELDEDNFSAQYRDYIADPEKLRTVPVELYKVSRFAFSFDPIHQNVPPIRSTLIDPSELSNTHHANKYLLELVEEQLEDSERVQLSLTYRQLKDRFLEEEAVIEANAALARNEHLLANNALTIGLDMTSRASWENTVQPHVNGIPIGSTGKGEQSNIKIRLAVEAANSSGVVLIEEPENHLSHIRLHTLLGQLHERAGERQFLISTHSSLVLNKLGVHNTIMFDGVTGIGLSDLDDSETERYFRKLPGHDTLRMILAAKTILVEGPSDELIVQKAYSQMHGVLPIENGVEVIAVQSLAFKRFLEIAKYLQRPVSVVTDNDGNPDAVREKYAEYVGVYPNISIHYDANLHLPTLEPQICDVNELADLNAALGRAFADKPAAEAWMLKNKTEAALLIADSQINIRIPEYIANAVR